MAALSVSAKLLRASQQAYDVGATGPVTIRAPFDQIGWLAPPLGVAAGPNAIDAALVGETETEIIVAFRGTLPPTSNSPDQRQVLLDWLGDFDAFLVAGADLPGLVHQGFLGALDALWLDVTNAVTPGKTLYFTGHSKGGAIANLAAARYQRQNQAVAAPLVTTFAAAKPGDRAFQAQYDQAIPHSVRYENRDDLVPHLPPSVNFQHNLGTIPIFRDSAPKADAHTPPGGEGYVAVGELQFINWDGVIVGFTPDLPLRRYLRLTELALFLQFGQIVNDHRIGDDWDYAKAILPPAARSGFDQAILGVSRLA